MSKPRIHAFEIDEFASMEAVDLSRLLQQGEVSAAELLAATLNRLAHVEPTLSACAEIQVEAAKAEAEKFDSTRSIHGFACLPTFLKDNLDLRGLPTRHGSLATSSSPHTHDSGLTRHMKKLGFNFVGKSRLPEFGLTATTEYGAQTPVRNPWNPGHSTGGSSGGSAALVAAGVAPVAHANDGGGSIRIPASCCGVVGLKPTRGRLPVNEMAAGLPVQIVSDGIVSRTVRDTAAFYSHSEKLFKNAELPPIGSVQNPSKKRLRIGFFVDSPTGGTIHQDCKQAVELTAARLVDLGHGVDLIQIPIKPSFAEDFLNYWAMMAASIQHFGRFILGQDFDPSRLEELTKGLSTHAKIYAWKLPLSISRLRRFEAQYADFFTNIDVILSPVLGLPPPELGWLSPSLNFKDSKSRLLQFACFTAAQNVSGAPAISVPVAVNADNLPVGIQLAAAKGCERQLLELALELEQFGFNQPLRELSEVTVD